MKKRAQFLSATLFSMFLVVFSPFFTEVLAQETGPMPKIYPGAVQHSEKNDRVFVTKDSFESVRAFYVRERGEPTSEHIVGETGKTAWFQYDDRPPDPGGVYVSFAAGQNRAVANAFSDLERYVTHFKVLELEEFEEIKARFNHLHSAYFIMDRLGDGRTFTKDEIIYRRCHDQMTGPKIEQTDMERIITQANELMMSGRTQEAMALLEQVRDSAMTGARDSVGRGGVDMWIECLQEMEKNAYTVLITISGM